ncbi:MAG TPA: DUF4870 domain-containing protein [Patescibacteria group bacterium]|nr:DUF4870 domain-containing protein [Patescibacteria group bacterium]
MENKKPKNSAQDAEENKILAAISYLGILCLIPILLKKDSKFVMFHAKQGLVLFIAEVAISFINIIPILGQMIWLAAALIFIVVSVMGIIKAYQGVWWKIPIVSEYAKKIKL